MLPHCSIYGNCCSGSRMTVYRKVNDNNSSNKKTIISLSERNLFFGLTGAQLCLLSNASLDPMTSSHS